MAEKTEETRVVRKSSKPSFDALTEKFRSIKMTLDEKKEGVNYAAWNTVWDEVLKVYPTAEYHVKTWPVFDEAGRAVGERKFTYEDKVGAFVDTSITIEGVTREMFLPVLDYNNYPMLMGRGYQVKTRKFTLNVAPMMSTDVNRTIMRCLVKNLAMFGIGLYIYKGKEEPDLVDAETGEVQNRTITMDPPPAAKGQFIPEAPVPAAYTQAPVTEPQVTAADPIEGMPKPIQVAPMTLEEAMNTVLTIGALNGKKAGTLVTETKSEQQSFRILTQLAQAFGKDGEAARTILKALSEGKLKIIEKA